MRGETSTFTIALIETLLKVEIKHLRTEAILAVGVSVVAVTWMLL